MILHVPVYDKRLSEDEGEWSDEDEENKLEELQTETQNFFYSREYQQVIFNSEVLLYTKEEEE
jgi:hypothetical protein